MQRVLETPITAYFPKGVALEMRVEAAKLNISRSQFLRLAVEKLLREKESTNEKQLAG